MLDTANNLNMVMVPTGRPSDPCEEVVTISSNSAEHRSHAYGTCAKNGGQPRVRRSIGKGSFKKHVDIILLIFDHPPTSVDTFYVLSMDKNGKF